MPGKRAGDAVIEQRVNEVFKLLRQGLNSAEICEYVQQAIERHAKDHEGQRHPLFGNTISDAQVHRYIETANELFIEAGEVHREKELGKSLSRYNMLFNRAVLDKKWFVAAEIQGRIDKLLALMAPRRIDVNMPEQMTDEQLYAEYQEIIAEDDKEEAEGPVLVTVRKTASRRAVGARDPAKEIHAALPAAPGGLGAGQVAERRAVG